MEVSQSTSLVLMKNYICVYQSLPKVLSINTGLHSAQHKQFWQTQMDKVVAKISAADISK